jgi:multidrug efflux pump subunit AcrA (membrane-fusion protein)
MEKRKTEDRAPGYDAYLRKFRADSPIINREGIRKSGVINAMGDITVLETKQGKLDYLQNRIVEADLTNGGDLADAGLIQRTEHALRNAETSLSNLNNERKLKGKPTLTPAEMPNDRRAEALAKLQAQYDVLLEEVEWLRKQLKQIEAQEAEDKKQEQIRKTYEGTIEGFHYHDPKCPRQIDGRKVTRAKDGTPVFKDDGEAVSEYMQECDRRWQERQAQAREAQRVIKQRGDLERYMVPRGVLRGEKSIHQWLEEQGETA